MKIALLVLLIALTVACDRSKIAPHISASLTMQRSTATDVVVKVRLKNTGSRATVPLEVEVTAGGLPVIHPVPFVLNHGETRDLQTEVMASSGARATLVVKEAERGRLVAKKTAKVD